jgi:hypothetical protein
LKSATFFVAFFLIFATAGYFIPTPMFPSNVILNLANASVIPQTAFLSALINGITYGLIAWAVFAITMRRISRESENSN